MHLFAHDTSANSGAVKLHLSLCAMNHTLPQYLYSRKWPVSVCWHIVLHH